MKPSNPNLERQHWPGSGGARLSSQQLGGRGGGKWVSVNMRPAWFTERGLGSKVTEKPYLDKKKRKNNKNKEIKTGVQFSWLTARSAYMKPWV